MKILYLVRHAKAIPFDSGVDDFKRALAKRGQNDAKAMGKQLRKKKITPDLLISSPADRALETAHIFAKKLEYPASKILLKDEMYLGEYERLVELIKTIDDQYHTLMLFGHNPAFSNLARYFVPDLEEDLRTTGVIGIAFDIASWNEIGAHTGKLLLFDFPVRATSAIAKTAQKRITNELVIIIEDLLEDIEPGTAAALEKTIQKTSKQLAQDLINILQPTKIEEIAGRSSLTRVDHLHSSAMGETAQSLASKASIAGRDDTLHNHELVSPEDPFDDDD